MMNPVAYDTEPLVRIMDEDVSTGPPTPFSPERRSVVRPSMVLDPEIGLAVGNGIMDGDSIQGAVATVTLLFTLGVNHMSCRDHRLTVCDVGSADGKMFHCVLIADSFMVHECDLGYIHTRAVCVLYIRGVLPIASNMRPNFFLSFCNIFLIKTGNFFGWFMVFMHHLLHFVAFCCLFSIRYRSQQPININESAFNMQKKNFSCECQVPWVGVRSHLKIH